LESAVTIASESLYHSTNPTSTSKSFGVELKTFSGRNFLPCLPLDLPTSEYRPVF
jgi:hypothetical protein